MFIDGISVKRWIVALIAPIAAIVLGLNDLMYLAIAATLITGTAGWPVLKAYVKL